MLSYYRWWQHIIISLCNCLGNLYPQELMDVNSKYIIGDQEIGSGHYGVVRTCTSRGEEERERAVQTAASCNDLAK